MDPKTGFAYFSNLNSNNVTVINGSRLVSSIAVGSGPFGCEYDPSDGWVYVLNDGGSNVSVINGTTAIGAISVGSEPDGATYDPNSQSIYVTNLNSSSVSVIKGMGLISTVPVGQVPRGIAFDQVNGLVYVANIGSQNITVLNGTKVVASIGNLSGQPFYVAFDPSNDLVYVAIDNSVPGFVDVISGLSVVARIPVGQGPWAPVVDPTNGWEYVSCAYSDNMTVLNGTQFVASLPLGNSPFPPVYDAGNGYVYVPNLGASPWNTPSEVSVVAGTRLVTSIVVGDAPDSGLYDPDNGWVYIPNGGNGVGRNVSAISTLLAVSPISTNGIESNGAPLEVGQTSVLAATLWGLGAGGASANIQSVPALGLNCLGQPIISLADQSAVLTVQCTPDAIGNYTVNLVVRDKSTAEVNVSGFIVVVAGPAASIAVTRTEFDVGQLAIIKVVGSGGSGGYTFGWTGLPGDCAPGTSSVNCTFTHVATYSIEASVTDSRGGHGSSDTVNLSIYQPLSLTPLSVSGPATIGGSIDFSAASVAGAPPVDYAWNFDDGTRSDLPSPTHVFLKAGTFRVVAWANDSANASVSQAVNVTIRASNTETAAPSPLPGLSDELIYFAAAGFVVIVLLLTYKVRRRRA